METKEKGRVSSRNKEEAVVAQEDEEDPTIQCQTICKFIKPTAAMF